MARKKRERAGRPADQAEASEGEPAGDEAEAPEPAEHAEPSESSEPETAGDEAEAERQADEREAAGELAAVDDGLPSFARSYPDDPELRALVRAFSDGNYARVREGAPRLAARTDDKAVARAARDLRARIEPDPLALKMLLGMGLLLAFLTYYFYTHRHLSSAGAERRKVRSPLRPGSACESMAQPHPEEHLATCPRHGLKYDPKLVRSCVMCRRERERDAPRPPPAWLAPVGAAVAIAGAAAVLVPIARTVRGDLSGADGKSGAASAPDAPEAARPSLVACLRVPSAGEGPKSIAPLASACSAACGLGAGRACRRLAGLCSPAAGDTVAPAPVSFCQPGPEGLLDKACASGDGIACGLRDDQRRAPSLSSSCSGGRARACADLASLCSPARPAVADDGPPTRWALLGTREALEACGPGPERLYSRACELGDAPSCDLLPRGSRPDAGRMRASLELACDRREPSACRSLAGLLGPAEAQRAQAMVRFAAELEACQARDAGSCSAVRSWRERGDEPGASTRERLETVDRACSAGDPVPCWEGAELLASGQAGPRDDARAGRLVSLAHKALRERCDGKSCLSPEADRQLDACDGGDGQACLEVSRAYPGGVSALGRRAARLLSEACERGQGPSCGKAADLFAGASGASPDPSRVAPLLDKGCSARDPESCARLARMTAQGEGMARDKNGSERLFRRAAELWASACEAGQKPACPKAAELYAQGQGVGKDDDRARKLRALGSP